MKIIFTGPESSGKTTLSQDLSQELRLPLVEEQARIYLEQKAKNYPYSYQDLVHIALAQKEAISKIEHPNLIIDTDFITLKIWALHKFNKYEKIWDEWQKSISDSITFLCYPDLNWVPDPLRENPLDRIELFKKYERELAQKDQNYVIITGGGKQRFERIWHHLKYMGVFA